MKQNMNFQRGQVLIKCLMGVAAALCAIALLVEGRGETSSFSVYAAVTAVVCIVLTIFVVAVAMKCPYCGRRIIRKCLTVKSCPHCHRDLVSGMRVKGKKGR